MKLFLLLLLLISNTYKNGTTGPKLSVDNVFVNQKDNTVHIQCEVANGSKEIVFYKPNNKSDFCLRMSYVLFKDLRSKRDSYYMPCNALADLNKIDITNENSIKLIPNAHYKFEFVLNQRGFNTKIDARKSYEILVNLNHKYICGGDTCKIFTGFLSTRKKVIIRSNI